VGYIAKRGLIDGILMTKSVTRLGRLKMVDQFIFAGKAFARNAAWASIDVAEEA
jgi:hypothetical protein